MQYSMCIEEKKLWIQSRRDFCGSDCGALGFRDTFTPTFSIFSFSQFPRRRVLVCGLYKLEEKQIKETRRMEKEEYIERERKIAPALM